MAIFPVRIWHRNQAAVQKLSKSTTNGADGVNGFGLTVVTHAEPQKLRGNYPSTLVEFHLVGRAHKIICRADNTTDIVHKLCISVL